jgi:precorrin-6Y C5,15-methyltransferase (decarboxylating)
VDRTVRTYLLTGGEVGEVCRTLETYNLNNVDIVVGENLSRDDEKLHFGKPKDFINREFSTLSVMYIENPNAKDVTNVGIPDSEFLRGSVPMTKSEVRAVSVSKCRLAHDSTCWDIGAGTGSVSVELALLSPDGMVYAVEKNPEGVELIQENAKRFRTSNVITIEGNAENVVETLPPPDVVFIGGSGGKLSRILSVALEKNPNARIIVNCITLETLTLAVDFADSHSLQCEVTQVSVTRTQRISRYHMFKAENPVYIVVVN